MIKLVPEWASQYDEFWETIQKRNNWFIKLRYIAVLFLLSFLISSELFLEFSFSKTQIIAIILISLFITSYNIVVGIVKKNTYNERGKFNPLHLSLLQMILDVTALMFLVYYTGTIESPLYIFFIFHMIIGSIILPGYIVYLMAVFIVIIFGILILLQRTNLIATYTMNGLYLTLPEKTLKFDVLFMIIFGFAMIATVYITNKIAHELYQREKQLYNSLAALNEAEKSKEKYIIGIVHELKTPISAVHSLLDVVIKYYIGTLNETIRQKLYRAKLRNEEAVELVNNILRISKLKLLNLRTLEEIELKSFINIVIEKQSEYAKNKNISIDFIDNRNHIKTFRGDKILLELAISNILNNAIKYNYHNGQILIELYDNQNQVIIEINDNGRGIPKDELNNVFNQFYRASNIEKTAIEGSGLGLTLVKEIIEKHNGRIEIDSPSKLKGQEGSGTVVRVFLPYDI
ncbi:ATP-binding protein [Melioribacteraceae bacterium 4301-Me]|uniref:ATP-binding protein n=1 Tax=Pyranulibacter aquaticus TaxID=3163344 RepID=UPI0035996868